MTNRMLTGLSLAALVAGPAMAATTLVDDNFDGYADNAALYSVWQPRNGGGSAAPAFPDDGILTTDATAFPDIQVQAVDHIGGSVLQHTTALVPGTPLSPTASESIHLAGDIFVGNDGNSRMSIGLRNRSLNVDGDPGASNLVELGTWNGATTDPVTGSPIPGSTTYAFRLILFGAIGGNLIQNPNWQYFQLDPVLDTNADGIVNPIDIGAGWHHYSALISPDQVTVELDLYRDGLDNGATLTAGSDVAGVDASMTYDISAHANGFDSLRIGSASGISSANGVAFDNLLLETVAASGGIAGDYNNSGLVEQGDLDLVLLNWGTAGTPAGWVNQVPVGLVDQAELDGVLLNWGNTAEPTGSAVPEPATAALLGLGALAMLRRRAA